MHLDDPAFRPSRDAAARSEFAAAAKTGRRYMWQELIGRLDPQTLEELMDWHVWAGDLERLSNDVLPIYRLQATLASDQVAQHRIARRAFDFGQAMLCCGSLAESLGFFRLAEELSTEPRFPAAVRRIEAVQKLHDEVRRAGGRARRTTGACTFAAALWDGERIADYLNYGIRSMLAPGNLPDLRDRELHFAIFTTRAGRRQIEVHPVYASINYYSQVHWFNLPETLNPLDGDSTLSELLDHLSIAFAQEFGSHVFLLPVDGIVARNTLVNLAGYLESGYHAVGAATLSATREYLSPQLEATFGSKPVLSASAQQLAELALQYLHEESSAKLIVPENQSFVRSPRELVWPIAEGMHSRCLYARPLAISGAALERSMEMRWSSLELTLRCGTFLNEADHRHYKIVPNAEEAYVGRLLSRRQVVERCGRPFDPRLVADTARCAGGLNRSLLIQPQLIPCEPRFVSDRDPEADIAEVLSLLEEHAVP